LIALTRSSTIVRDGVLASAGRLLSTGRTFQDRPGKSWPIEGSVAIHVRTRRPRSRTTSPARSRPGHRRSPIPPPRRGSRTPPTRSRPSLSTPRRSRPLVSHVRTRGSAYRPKPDPRRGAPRGSAATGGSARSAAASSRRQRSQKSYSRSQVATCPAASSMRQPRVGQCSRPRVWPASWTATLASRSRGCAGPRDFIRQRNSEIHARGAADTPEPEHPPVGEAPFCVEMSAPVSPRMRLPSAATASRGNRAASRRGSGRAAGRTLSRGAPRAPRRAPRAR